MDICEEILLKGIPISEGIAIGSIYFPQVQEHMEVPKFAITADQVDRELEKYRKALALSREDLQHLEYSLTTEGLREAAKIIETHLEMLSDPFLTSEMEGKVRNERYNVEAIFRTTMQEFALRFKTEDTFFQQRLVDVMDVSNRVLGHLQRTPNQYFQKAPRGCVMIANDLDASAVASTEAKQRVAGFVTSSGATGSHAALIARSRGIPYVAMVDLTLFYKYTDKIAIVDGQNGFVILNPSHETLENYKNKQKAVHLSEEKQAADIQFPSETYEGHSVCLMVNISSLDELSSLHQVQPAGVGLLRSEFLFAGIKYETLEEEIQYQIFKEAIDKVKGLCVVIRLFDFGGDKQLPRYVHPFSEKNPLMGCRGIRYLFYHPKLLKTHLRALLRVAASGCVRLLVPFVSQVEEMRSLRRILQEVSQELEKERVFHCKDLQVGCMLEVPSALFLIAELAPYCDFFSLGTNDLTQYVLGVDRVNPLLEALYQPLHPSILRLMHRTILEVKEIGKPISLCGEIASQPLFTPLLLGLGLEELSVIPKNLLKIKQQIRRCSILEAYKLARTALSLEEAEQVFQLCWKFSEKLS